MDADFLRQCLFLYPDWETVVKIGDKEKVLRAVRVDSEKQRIVLEGLDRSDTRDLG